MRPRAKILLVDDEELVRRELGGLLEDEGYSVVSAGDGEEGLALFRRERPDMVITDVRMPRADGLSLAVTIREISPTTPVTVVTGHGSEQMAVHALRVGVTDFVRKPVRLEELTAALARMEAVRDLERARSLSLPSSARLVERAWTYELDNDLEAVPTVVDVVLRECGAGLLPATLSELSLALRELLINAIEHGNLGLSYEDKAKALEQGRLERVLTERTSCEPYASRRVTLVVRRGLDQLVADILDQGTGFDWQTLPDPTDPQNLLAAHGRGVLLAQMSVDSLTYSEEGTRAVVVKRLGALRA